MESQVKFKDKGGNHDVVLEIRVPSSDQAPDPSAKPPIVPAAMRRRSLSRSAYSKPKSRIAEPPSSNSKENDQTSLSKSPHQNSSILGSPSVNVKSSTPKTSAPTTPKTPLMVSVGGDDGDEEDDEVYNAENVQIEKVKRGKKVKRVVMIESIAFICIMAVLIASRSVNKLKHYHIWSLELWKWCVLVLVIFCGRLLTEWLSNVLVFLIEKNFLMKKKVLYFVFGLKKSVHVVVWLALILVAWALLINRGVKRSKETAKILNYITRGIISTLVGAIMWMVKTLLIKLVASSFHVRTYFDRIQESIFHQYILQALSGLPMAENDNSKITCQLSFNKTRTGKEERKGEVINVDKLYKIKREKVSAWTMGGLIKLIRNSELPTISEVLDDSVEDETGAAKVITSEVEARVAANRIFRNVAKHGHKYIEEGDLLQFMPKEEVENALPLFEGAAESRRITKSSFRNWVLLLVVFMFGNTAKMVFEAIIFVFITHPFDVGDRCVVDGVQMIVDEMNILSTVFLKPDNEKVYYPNSVLAIKPISNFNRSPEMMGDSVVFVVDFSTSVESIPALRAKIKAYLESKPKHWSPNHSVQIKEIVDVDKMTLALYVTHTINFQNSADRGSRRSDLVFELKKILEELSINYRLLPQEVQISYVGAAAMPPPTTVAR
ncbi:hypothetical protein BUALT_Bualt16G0045800 [Buddleja alternifolia]|uniref:Mechanosensitive ion channel protein n=1 Tax=Buddleja alternifolia TaxID=168488 RepID=A0AAV6WJP1_9LAMI|nr:hypothetical protein BUALT_Bualt16G0045800 [Buddleja alternifolia]